jgi:hypothetical protein
VAKVQQYRCHNFEPACYVHTAQFCQPTVYARAHICRLDSNCDLSRANLICSFLVSNLQHMQLIIMRFIPTATLLLHKQSVRYTPRDKHTNARRSPSCTVGTSIQYVTRTERHENTWKLTQKVPTCRVYSEPTAVRYGATAGQISVGLHLTTTEVYHNSILIM